eukprot:SAG25_NODE_6845_length_525_cov_0.971831_2_plen_108_part_01
MTAGVGCAVTATAQAVKSPAIGAILHAYYPQHQAGEAIADVLLGVVSPAGRMPYTWPRDLSLAGDITNDGVLPLKLPRPAPPGLAGFNPCDGNTTGGVCGTAANRGFC